MKALIVMPLGEIRGGSEMMLWHLLRYGRDSGMEWIVVFTEDGPMVEQVKSLGVETRLVPAGRLRNPLSFLDTARKIARIAYQKKAEVIIGWIATGQLYGGIAAQMARLPALWYQLFVPTGEGMIDNIATRIPARGVIACSQAGKEGQERLTPKRPTTVVYPGVELDRYNPTLLPTPHEMRAKLGLPTTGPLIGIVGRLQKWKGMHTLIHAMPQIRERYPDATAVIVGGQHAQEPEYEEYLHQRIQALGLQDAVRMVGLQQNVEEWVQAMDVAVHASAYEPFGIVVIEAMAMGKPLVAGDKGGPAEIITPEVNGLLSPYEDEKALAANILRYLDNPEWAAQIGAAARQRAMEFSAERYAANLITAFENFLQSRPS